MKGARIFIKIYQPTRAHLHPAFNKRTSYCNKPTNSWNSRKMQYSYTPIPANHIRLLKPARNTGLNSHSTLTFTFETHPISKAPPYTAISYVWGLSSTSQEIHLNSRPFPIRQNLWSCLHYLLKSTSSPSHSIDWTYIWVDAICINQRDEREKSQQVRAMDEVYSNAVVVSTWLGFQRPPNWMQWREPGVKTFEHYDWFLPEYVLEIAEREYWSRMWIVQELVLARRIRVHVSDKNFNFDELAWEVREMQKSDDDGDFRQLLAHVNARDSDFKQPLHELLLRFKNCKCSDPRDKVFALLSLLDSDDKRNLSRCFPDYTLTHDAVVVITLHYLQENHGQVITCDSNDLFESLGGSSSRLMRRRLLAASTTLFDLRSIGAAKDFREVPFYFWEHPAETQQPTTHRRLRDFVRCVGVNVWWIGLCGGVLWHFRREVDSLVKRKLVVAGRQLM